MSKIMTIFLMNSELYGNMCFGFWFPAAGWFVWWGMFAFQDVSSEGISFFHSMQIFAYFVEKSDLITSIR